MDNRPKHSPRPPCIFSLPALAALHCSETPRRKTRLLSWQQSAHSKPNVPLPVGPQPLPYPEPYWVLVLPACTAYAWLVPWYLLFIRLFLLNFCFCLAHLARVVPVFLMRRLHSAAALPPLPSLCHFPSISGPLSTLRPQAGALDLGCRSIEGPLQPVGLPRHIGELNVEVTLVSWGMPLRGLRGVVGAVWAWT